MIAATDYFHAKNLINYGNDIAIYPVNYQEFYNEYFRADGIYAINCTQTIQSFTLSYHDLMLNYTNKGLTHIINRTRIFPIFGNIKMNIKYINNYKNIKLPTVYLALCSDEYKYYYFNNDIFYIGKKIITIRNKELDWRDAL